MNVYSEDIILRDAGVVDETWPLIQRGYVDTEPLFDPNDLFSRVRKIACESAKADFKPWIRNLIVGEIYELVGKVRNAVASGSASVTVLGVDIVRYCAFLIGMAKAIRARLQVRDTCVRYSGDEFIALLPGVPEESISSLADRVDRAAREYSLEVQPGRDVQLTLSIGWATLPHDGDDFEALIAVATSRMKQHKQEMLEGGRILEESL